MSKFWCHLGFHDWRLWEDSIVKCLKCSKKTTIGHLRMFD